MHAEQVEQKKQVLSGASGVDDMYDMLAAYEQKVPTADQVRHTHTHTHTSIVQAGTHTHTHTQTFPMLTSSQLP